MLGLHGCTLRGFHLPRYRAETAARAVGDSLGVILGTHCRAVKGLPASGSGYHSFATREEESNEGERD
jgi:hypothetical protein